MFSERSAAIMLAMVSVLPVDDERFPARHAADHVFLHAVVRENEIRLVEALHPVFRAAFGKYTLYERVRVDLFAVALDVVIHA